jgi:hypothetical protein
MNASQTKSAHLIAERARQMKVGATERKIMEALEGSGIDLDDLLYAGDMRFVETILKLSY